MSARPGRGVRRLLFVGLCLLLAVGFAGLGAWQVERRAQKLDLIARVEARVGAAPVPLPATWPADAAYRRVRVSGVFSHGSETLVQALTERGAGWWVVTPLRTAGPGLARTVLVNRGYVPPERADPRSREEGQRRGTVTVVGLLRASEPGGGFLRRNDPARDRWYSRDVAAIAAARGLRGVAPLFIDADATPNPGGFPVGGLTVIAFANNHLVYALTWFALAALSLLGAALLLRPDRRVAEPPSTR